MQSKTRSELEIELESRLRDLGYDAGVTVHAIGTDGEWGARDVLLVRACLGKLDPCLP